MHVKPDGDKVRALRGKANAAEFAREAGITPTTLRRSERCGTLTLNTARKIGAVAGVHPR